MSKPVITAEHSCQETFEADCERMISEGYKLVASDCGCVNDAKYDYCSYYMAVFALPEAMQ